MKFIYGMLVLMLFVSITPSVAQEDVPYPPIVFVTSTEVYTWDETNGLQFIMTMPTPYYGDEINRRSRVWSDVAISPDLKYMAYIIKTVQWQKVIAQELRVEDDIVVGDIHVVDLETGMSMPITRQTTDDPYAQTLRWSLEWTPDSQQLLWFEDAEEGNIVSFDIATNETTILIENAAPYHSRISIYRHDRLVVSNYDNTELTDPYYSVYSLGGTLIREVGELEYEEWEFFPYIFREGDTDYFATDLQRVNLENGDISPTPSGHLIRVASNVPDTSLRIEPPVYGDEGCVANVFDIQGNNVTRITLGNPMAFAPDGRAIIYEDSDTFVIVHVDGAGAVERTELPTIPGFVNYVNWSTASYIFEPDPAGFNGTFSCGAG